MCRRRVIIFSAAIISSFFVCLNPVFAKVLIGAVAPQLSTAENEYVELYNYSSTSVNLAGWSLKKIASTGSSSTLVSDFGAAHIVPFGYFLVAHNNYLPIDGVAADKVYTVNSNNLAAINNGVILIDDVGQLIDAVFWGNVSSSLFVSGVANPGTNKSLVRRPDDETGNFVDSDDCGLDFFEIDPMPRNSLSEARPIWIVPIEATTTPTTTVPTTTTEGDVGTSSLWSMLRLSEVVSDPNEGDEWVELWNGASSSLDLSGGLICDSRGIDASSTACKDLLGVISPLDFFVFSWGGYFLNNDTPDSVVLKSPSGEIIDRLDYGDGGRVSAPEKGESLARYPDGMGDWWITTDITSGTANHIVAPTVGGSGGGSNYYPTTPIVSNTTTKVLVKKDSATLSKKDNSIIWKITYPTKIIIGVTTTFVATGTLDMRGGKFSFIWNFGEGVTTTGATPGVVFVSSGVHYINIFATSTAGSVGEKQIKIMVYPTTTTASAVVISAVLPNETGTDDSEYIKIKNTGTSTTDISRWKILYKSDVYQIPASTTIIGGDELVFYKAITKFNLNNSGGEVELRDVNDFLVDVFGYGKTKEGVEIVSSATSSVGVISSSTGKVAPIKLARVVASKIANAYLGLVSLEQARAAEDNVVTRVRGLVTALPGVFGSQYFYIFDGVQGLQIYQNKKDFPALQVGDGVEVYGTLGTAYGARRLRVKTDSDVDILSTQNSIKPLVVEISEIDEFNLGALIKISGTITEIKSNFMYVDDGTSEAVVYFKKGAQIDKKRFKEGENMEVVGVLEKGSSGLQIWPRSQEDLVSLGLSEDLIKSQALLQQTQNDSKKMAETYLTTTAGGITALLLAFLARARGALIVGGVKKVAQLAVKIIGRG